MKFLTLQAALGSALAFGAAQPALAELHGHRNAHQHYGKRNNHQHADALLEARQPDHQDGPAHGGISKRAVCTLPDHPDLVTVPGAKNGGFAMAPDRECAAGDYCPIACVSGKVMAQWKPGTTYTYPESMDGGLYCDDSGTPQKPYTSKPYCVDGTGTVSAVNNCGSVVSFCQTVLPGDEGMYIPTDVTGTSTLAVPGPSYWDSTAAHYYINPPGTDGATGCVWGTSAEPIGNWSPYVAGANTDNDGLTYVKIGWNPIFTGCDLSSTKPTFGLKIECEGDGCNGLPCAINSDNVDDFSVTSPDSASGAGGATFCVVTVPSGGSANIVVSNFDGSSSSSSSSSKSSSSSSSSTTTTSSSTTSSSTTSTSSSTSSSSSTTSSSTSSSSSSSSSSQITSSSSSSSSSDSSAVSSSSSYSSWSSSSTSGTTTTKHTATKTKTKAKATTTTLPGGIFQENGTYSGAISASSGYSTAVVTDAAVTAKTTGSAASATGSAKNEASNRNQGGAAVVGLIVAVVAGLWLY